MEEEAGSSVLERMIHNGEPEVAADVIGFIASKLSSEERADFGLQLMDAIREEGQERIEDVLESWLASVGVRIHPDSARQRKEYENLVTSGELFSGTDLLADA